MGVPVLPHALETSRDLLGYFVLAGLLGAFAAVISELLISRGKSREQGVFEVPTKRGKWIDIGSFAAPLVGLLAAVIIAWLLAPIAEVPKEGTTTNETETQYDIFRLVAISLLAGLSSSSVLVKLQEGFSSIIDQERLKTTLETVRDGLDAIEDQAAQVTDVADAPPPATEEAARVTAGVTAATATLKQQIQRALDRSA